eukprot:6492610-Amphidinium_carterae.2
MRYSLRYPKWESGGSQSGIKKSKVFILREPVREGGPLVFWQLQDFLACVLPASVIPHRWLNRHGCLKDADTWRSELQFHEGDFIPSTKSAKAKSGRVADHSESWSPQLAVASSKCLCAHLLQWHIRLREPERRKVSKQLLSDLVAKVLVVKHAELPLQWFVPPEVWNDVCCSRKELTPSGCCHVDACCTTWLRNGSVSTSDLGSFLAALASHWSTGCPRLMQYLARLIHCICRDMDAVLMSADCPFPNHGLGEGMAVRGLKRRRVLDSDMLREGVVGAIESKRYKSGQAMVRAGTADISLTEGKLVESHFCLRYYARNLSAFSSSRAVTLAFDETNLGNEKTLCGVIQDVALGVASYVVPQVKSKRS